MSLKKLLGGVEDLSMGMEVEHQERRGTIVFIQQINGMFIPYSVTQSLTQKIDQVDLKADSNVSSINNHKSDINNPHKVTIEQIGAAASVHYHDDRYFMKTNHVNSYGGVSFAGKPIVLDSEGYIAGSLLTAGGLYYQGPYTPTDLNPYPDTTNLKDGSFWLVDELGQGIDYTWVSGDLNGKTAFDGYFMFWSSNGGWSLRESDPAVNVYYALDGSRALTANFSGGGFKITNIVDGTDLTDGVTLQQLDTKVLWRNKWDGGKTPYSKNDMVLDVIYTMIANKETDDRPAPQLIGYPSFAYQGTLSPFANTAKQVIFGQRYTVDKSVQLSKYRVDVVAGNDYIVYSVDDPLGAKIYNRLSEFKADIDGWFELSIPPIFVVKGGIFDVVVLVKEPASTPLITVIEYDYNTPNNTRDANNGEIVHAGKSTNTLSISYIDSNAVNQEAVLDTLAVGDRISVEGITWSIQSISKLVDTYSVGITPPTQVSGEGLKDFKFESVVATPITVGREIDYNLGNVNVRGLIGVDIDYDLITPDNNQYGIDIEFQEVTLSEDWDFVAISSTSSSSGGSSSGLPDETDQKGKSVTNHGSKGDAFWSFINTNPIVMTEDQVLDDGVSASVVGGFTINDGIILTIPDGSVLAVV